MKVLFPLVLLQAFVYLADCIPIPKPKAQGADFQGLDPNFKFGRLLDRLICPKDDAGNYIRNSSFCHRVHMGWHKVSGIVDKTFGGTGEFDKDRFEAHQTALYKDV